MSVMGTDVVALACILGGAAVAGGVTLALDDGRRSTDVSCSAESLGPSPRVVVSVADGSNSIVVAPSLHLEGHCGALAVLEPLHASEVRARTDLARAREQVKRAREQVDGARLRLEQAHERSQEARDRVEGARVFVEDAQVRELRERLEREGARVDDVEIELEGLEELLELELEERLGSEMERLRERLERIGVQRGG